MGYDFQLWGREHPHPSLSSEPLANSGLQERWGGWEENRYQPMRIEGGKEVGSKLWAGSWRPHAVRQFWGARLHRVLFPHSSSSQGHYIAGLGGVTAHSPFILQRLLICAIHLPAQNHSLLCTIVYQWCWQNCFIFKTKTWSHSLLSMAGESRTRQSQLCTIMALPLLQQMMKLIQLLSAPLGFFCMPSHLPRRPLPTLPEKPRWSQGHPPTAVTASSPSSTLLATSICGSGSNEMSIITSLWVL